MKHRSILFIILSGFGSIIILTGISRQSSILEIGVAELIVIGVCIFLVKFAWEDESTKQQNKPEVNHE